MFQWPWRPPKPTGYREITIWYRYKSCIAGVRQTANGEVFSPKKLTEAHKRLPLPAFVNLTNLENSHLIIVRVNDRYLIAKHRIIDLSAAVVKKLVFYKKGTAGFPRGDHHRRRGVTSECSGQPSRNFLMYLPAVRVNSHKSMSFPRTLKRVGKR